MRQPNMQRTQKQSILEDRATVLTQSILPLNKPQKPPNQLSPSKRLVCTAAAAAARSLQSCPTLCNPKDGSPPGSPVPGILQARILEWIAISFSQMMLRTYFSSCRCMWHSYTCAELQLPHLSPIIFPHSEFREMLSYISLWKFCCFIFHTFVSDLCQINFFLCCEAIGEGNGNPLQCSCLENPRDGGAWWAAVFGVAQSQTRLKRLSSSSSSRLA